MRNVISCYAIVIHDDNEKYAPTESETKFGNASNFDISIDKDLTLYPNQLHEVVLGWGIEMPSDAAFMLMQKYTVVKNTHLQIRNSAGLITDSSPIKVLLFNDGENIIKLKAGQKIAQLAMIRLYTSL